MSHAVLDLFSYTILLLEIWIIASAAAAFFTRSCSTRFYILSLLALFITEVFLFSQPWVPQFKGKIIGWVIMM